MGSVKRGGGLASVKQFKSSPVLMNHVNHCMVSAQEL